MFHYYSACAELFYKLYTFIFLGCSSSRYMCTPFYSAFQISHLLFICHPLSHSLSLPPLFTPSFTLSLSGPGQVMNVRVFPYSPLRNEQKFSALVVWDSLSQIESSGRVDYYFVNVTDAVTGQLLTSEHVSYFLSLPSFFPLLFPSTSPSSLKGCSCGSNYHECLASTNHIYETTFMA